MANTCVHASARPKRIARTLFTPVVWTELWIIASVLETWDARLRCTVVTLPFSALAKDVTQSLQPEEIGQRQAGAGAGSPHSIFEPQRQEIFSFLPCAGRKVDDVVTAFSRTEIRMDSSFQDEAFTAKAASAKSELAAHYPNPIKRRDPVQN